MGKDGNVTLSNLKNATGIADDRLSAHNPNGAGTNTRLGNFLVGKIGRYIFSNEWVNQNITTDINGDPHGKSEYDTKLGLDSSRVGQVDSDGNWTFDSHVLQEGDVIEIRIETDIESGAEIGKHFLKAIVEDGAGFVTSSVSGLTDTGNHSITTNSEGHEVIDLEYEVTGFNSVGIRFNLEDTINVDALHYGDPSTQSGISQFATNLEFQCNDVQSDAVFLDRIDIFYSNLGGSGQFFGCDLNSLDSGETAGDDTFSSRAQVQINDPANRFPNANIWVFLDDDVTSLGCPGSGQEVAAGSANCFEYQTTKAGSANPTARIVLTETSFGASVIDEREVTYSPARSGQDEGQVTQTFNSANASTTC